MQGSELLLSAVCGAVLKRPVETSAEPEIRNRACALAKSHDLSQIMLEGMADVALPAWGRDLLLRNAAAAVARFYAQNAALERLSTAFDESGIDYMPLKGAVLRHLYPNPEWRVGRDLDILVRRYDFERALDVATKLLSPTEVRRGGHDVGIVLPDGVRIELHFALFNEGDGLDALLGDPFATAMQEAGCRYRMSDAALYAYHVAHMAKHFRGGGCGLRAFLDLFLLGRAMSEETLSQARSLLKAVDLLQFEAAVSRQSRVFFDGACGDEDTARLSRFVLENQSFGSFRSQAALQQRKGEKKGGFWRRVFPPYRVMCCLYPILRRVPILLPFCWILRGLRFFSKKDRARFLAASRAALRVGSGDVDELSLVYQYLRPEG